MALLSFTGIYALARRCQYPKLAPILGVMAFSLAALTRSNGILLGVFFLNLACVHSPCMTQFITTGVNALLGLIPYLVFTLHQAISARTLCMDLDRPYCDTSPLQYLVPRLHGYVQSEYWGVGPFKYWHAHQLGNWVLASGVLLFTTVRIWDYFSPTFINANLLRDPGDRLKWLKKSAMLHDNTVSMCYAHWAALTLYMLVMSQIQVITRVFVSLPAFFLELGRTHNGYPPLDERSVQRWRLWTFWYASIGLFMYASFYPPA